jgi:adenylate cyclase class 2
MSYEVELKFRLEQPGPVEALLREHGAVERSVFPHADSYFNHPSRDFRTTDEALRIRSVGDINCVTYKGPVIGNLAKTRREIEIGFANGTSAADQLFEMVRLLGFEFVREVRKTRRSFELNWNGDDFELALDEVPGLGNFLEIEVLAEDDRRTEAEAAVWKLARSLGLRNVEPRSYLSQLLEHDGPPGEC